MKVRYLILAIAFLFGCVYAGSEFPAIPDHFAKPEKKQAALPGNFEIVIGEKLRAPIDQKRFFHSVLLTAKKLGLRSQVASSNRIIVNSTNTAVRICFGEDEYWYEYVDSRNLNANPKENRMPDNYIQFLEALETGISGAYASPESAAAPQPTISQLKEQETAAPASFTPPQRKVQAKPNNFEVISGKYLRSPLNEDSMRYAIIKAAGALGYRPLPADNPNSIVLYKTRGRSWWVKIKIVFWKGDYWFEYVDSYGLKAEPRRNRIHRNYFRWVNDLDSKITFYYKSHRSR